MSVKKLVERGLREHVLTAGDVQQMLQGERISNPFSRESKANEYHFFLGFELALPALSDVEMASARDEIQKLLSVGEAPRPLLSGQLLDTPQIAPSVGARIMTWYKSADGEPFLATFNTENLRLQIFSPTKNEIVLDRQLGDPDEYFPSPLGNTSQLYASSDGRLILAASLMSKSGPRILLVHDVFSNKSWRHRVTAGMIFPGLQEKINFVKSSAGKLYLVLKGDLGVHVFDITVDSIETLDFRSLSPISLFATYASNDGKVFIAITVGNELQLLDVVRGKVLGSYKPKGGILNLAGTFTVDNHFLVALQVRDRYLGSERLEFLGLGSSVSLSSGPLGDHIAFGEWHTVRDGPTLFAAGATHRAGNSLLIYNPIVSANRDNRWYHKFFKRMTIKPVAALPLEEKSRVAVKWLELPDGTPLLATILGSAPDTLALYSPFDLNPVTTFPIEIPPLSALEISQAPQRDHLLFFANSHATSQFELFEYSDSVRRVLHGQASAFTPVVTDRNGDLLVAVDRFDSLDRKSDIKVYKLVTQQPAN